MSDRTRYAIVLAALPAILYLVVAMIAFRFRNPTANDATCWRELPAVLRFERVAQYQGNTR